MVSNLRLERLSLFDIKHYKGLTMLQNFNPSLNTIKSLEDISDIDTMWVTIDNNLVEILSFESDDIYYETSSLQDDFNDIKEFLSLD